MIHKDGCNIQFANEACGNCGVPCDLHIGPNDKPKTTPHSTWGDLNRCLTFQHSGRAAYGELPNWCPCQRQPQIESAGMFRGLNLGSGQRRFDTSYGWVNVDSQSVPPDRVPDVVCDGRELVARFGEEAFDVVVLHQALEHFGCGEADEVLRQCWETLRRRGSLIITVPDMRALAGRWLGGEIDTQLYMTNVYGAYMGDEGDRHRWGYTSESLRAYLIQALTSPTSSAASLAALHMVAVRTFDWRSLPGANIARDWWTLEIEAVKP